MTKEKTGRSLSGWMGLFLHLLFIALMAWLLVSTISGNRWSPPYIAALALLLIAIAFVFPFGYFTLQPNEAKALILFGSYKGTVRQDGFHWINP